MVVPVEALGDAGPGRLQLIGAVAEHDAGDDDGQHAGRVGAADRQLLGGDEGHERRQERQGRVEDDVFDAAADEDEHGADQEPDHGPADGGDGDLDADPPER